MLGGTTTPEVPLRYDPEPAARICYAALRQLREEQALAAGEPPASAKNRRGPVWNLLVKAEQGWYIRFAELARRGILPRDIHADWQGSLLEEDWKPGPEADHDKRTHPELADWEDLDDMFKARFSLFQIMAVGMEFSAYLGGLCLVITT